MSPNTFCKYHFPLFNRYLYLQLLNYDDATNDIFFYDSGRDSFLEFMQQAWLGGKNTVLVTPQHHGRNIPRVLVYVKFGTQNLPGTSPSNNDANFTTSGGSNSVVVTVDGLKEGDYYFYGIGFDSLISLPVTGSLPVTMKNSSGTTSMNLPITE